MADNLVSIRLLKGPDLLCPSTPGSPEDSLLIGVVTSHPEGPRIVPTEEAMPVTPEILEMAGPVSPSEVFRFTSTCRSERCPHFSGNNCQLAVRATALLQPVADGLPKCPIRSLCRWFRQEGRAICERCPQIITNQYTPYEKMLEVVNGGEPPPKPSGSETSASEL